MKTDMEIRVAGLRALTEAMGPVEAERFIALVLREPFDYTEWRQSLWEGMDAKAISEAAMTRQNTEK
jgi:hypothetical protein